MSFRKEKYQPVSNLLRKYLFKRRNPYLRKVSYLWP